MRTVLITGADRGLGLAFTKLFLERGFQVFAGQYMPGWPELEALREKWGGQLCVLSLDISDEESVKNAAVVIGAQTKVLDMVVNNAGIMRLEKDILEEVPEEDMMLQFRINALGALKVTEQMIGLMEGGMKRLCYVSSEAGSIGNAHRDGMFGYCMSKAALNMGIRMLHNDLYKKGFTFRIYHPGWMKSYMAGEAGDVNMNGYLEPEMTAAVAFKQFLSDRNCENILAMQDVDGYLWSF